MMLRSASLPTRLRSSPWPAMPTTSDPKISGTTMDLIREMKMVENGPRTVAMSVPGQYAWLSQPITTPAIIATTIQVVSEILRMRGPRAGGVSGGERACLLLDAIEQRVPTLGKLAHAVLFEECRAFGQRGDPKVRIGGEQRRGRDLRGRCDTHL